jgi:hypothetical protein
MSFEQASKVEDHRLVVVGGGKGAMPGDRRWLFAELTPGL